MLDNDNKREIEYISNKDIELLNFKLMKIELVLLMLLNQFRSVPNIPNSLLDNIEKMLVDIKD